VQDLRPLRKSSALFANKNKTPAQAKAAGGPSAFSLSFQGRFFRLSLREQMLFAKRLSFMVRAGAPLIDGLSIMQKQARTRGSRAIYNQLIKDVENGQYLHTSLGRTKRLFGDFGISVIRVGEMSGTLSENLAYLAEELEKRTALRKKVLGALLYPAFITVATLGVSTLLTAYIFPKIMPIFQSLNVDLPLTTRVLIAVSVYLHSYGLYTLFALIVGGIGAAVLYQRTEGFRYAVDRTLLALPIAGTLIRSYNMTNFARMLGILLKSGMTSIEALEVIVGGTVNRVYRADYRRIGELVLHGKRISTHLEAHSRYYPPTLAHMIAIGETTGNLPETLLTLADMYEKEVDDLTRNLSSLIEPILMIVMGVLVGLIAVSVITPIYGITQHLSPR